MSRLLYSFEDAQITLGGISRANVYRLVKAGEIEVVHIGRRALITGDSLQRFVVNLGQYGSASQIP